MKDEKSIGKFDFLASLSERLQSDANVKTIYGEPIEVEGKTIITVGKVAYGLGGGYGAAKGVENQLGEGGGGGIIVSPLGVYEISGNETRFVPLRTKKIPLFAAFAAGFALAKWLTKRGKRF